MENLTKKHIKQVRIVFSKHDGENVGLLDGPNLLKALAQLDLTMSKDDLPDLFASVGREKEGLMAVDDFVDLVIELRNTDDYVPENPEEQDDNDDNDDNEDEILGTDIAFNMLIDRNLNAITLDTLIRVCKEQNEDWSRQQVMEMMNQGDLDRDGIIDLNEFRELCKRAGLSK
ncbi:EF-hand [Backusella circina FSU 941]|nr:EF-hand [Backusella circina FSU 941]